MMAQEPRFLCDRMLAKAARWLAMMGYDSRRAGDHEIDDLVLMEAARREGRVLLTRDTRLPPAKGLSVLVLRQEGLEAQLGEVLAALGLTPDAARFFTRCTLCNAVLVEEDKTAVAGELPVKVRSLDTRVFRCPVCRHLYWTGTHVARARALFERLAAGGKARG